MHTLIDRLRSEGSDEIHKEALTELKKLQTLLADPSAVHLNMLRGSIAKPSPRQIVHIYGRDVLAKTLADPDFTQ